ncbi:MAG: alpha/beta hydrolase [Rhodovibrionaceae bacterium]|nr:alpha/beta hydrolase [Rhodovibrionaceae bacterium]
MPPARALVCVLLISLLATCVSPQSWEATRLLRDIQAKGGPSELKRTTAQPRREAIAVQGPGRRTTADLYHPGGEARGRIILVHGFTPHGKNDARLVALAESLARVGFLVMTPDLPGSKATRISEADAQRLADALVHLAERDEPGVPKTRPGLFAISYAVGLAVQASAEPRARERLGVLVSLGGFYDTRAVIRFITTGRHRDPLSGAQLDAAPRPASKWLFLAGNAAALKDARDRRLLTRIAWRKLEDPGSRIDDLTAGLSAEGGRVLELIVNDDPVRVDGLIARLPERMRAQMQRLSPSAYDLSHLAGRLILIHGREDRMIPYTQSVAFARAVEQSELFLIPDFSHIDPAGVSLAGRLALIDAAQAVLERRR